MEVKSVLYCCPLPSDVLQTQLVYIAPNTDISLKCIQKPAVQVCSTDLNEHLPPELARCSCNNRLVCRGLRKALEEANPNSANASPVTRPCHNLSSCPKQSPSHLGPAAPAVAGSPPDVENQQPESSQV